MRLRGRLCGLILIVSALLLSAPNRSCATQSNDRPAAENRQATQSNNADTDPATPIHQTGSADPVSQQTYYNTYNYCQPAQGTWLPFLGQIAAIVSAILLTAFTGGLWYTSIRQWRVLRDGNRPMLLVDHVELMAGGDFEKGKRISPAGISVSSLNIRFRNYGTGPAIIEKAVANLRLIPEPTPFYGHDQPHDFRDCIELTQAMC